MKNCFIILIISFIFSTLCAYSGDLKVSYNIAPVKCFSGDDGSIDVAIENGAGPYNFKLVKIVKQQVQIIQEGNFNKNGYLFQNLKADSLIIEITDAKGHSCKDTMVMTEPEQLKAGSISIVEVSKGIGKLKANPIGGTLPYSYRWSFSNGSFTGEYLDNAAEGIYKVEINDTNNCGSVQATIFFVRQQFPEYFNE